MGKKPERLVLVRESRIHRLIPGGIEDDRLEASGVIVLDSETCLVVFDNLNRVARLDLSLEPSPLNRLLDAPSPGVGFEDIAVDSATQRFFLLIEAMRDENAAYKSRVGEYDRDLGFMRCDWLDHVFEGDNRGFEGLAYVQLDERRFLWALCEGNLCKDRREGGGRVQVFERAGDSWVWSREAAIPAEAEFADYSGIDIRNGRVAVVSQASARLWCSRLNSVGTLESGGTVYRFPKGQRYCNVEGVAWIDERTLVMVSDRRKRRQARECEETDQSIHIFRLPDDGESSRTRAADA